jgi:histidine triad (HIT) family protein
MLSEQEAEEIKQKIISQIESTFPEEQILSAKEQIEAMNSDELENFLEKNKLIKNENPEEDNECVFCSIANGKIKSVKIGENESAVAVLDINPLSKGHSLVIPKEHTDSAGKNVFNLAESVSKKLKEKFNPEKIEIKSSKLFGHEIINVIPQYKENNSERKKATMEELEEVKKELESEIKVEEKISPIEKIKEIFRLPKRIP